MKRLSCRLALAIVLVLGVSGAGGCGFVRPPALTIAQNAASDPFYTFSADELFAELNKEPATGGGTTTLKPTVDATAVAELLTSKVRPQIVQRLLADRAIVPSPADRTAVEQMAQQQQQPPTDDELAFQTNLVALANKLADEFFTRPGNNVDDYARRYYDQRKDSFTTEAQTCLHVATVDAPTEAPADPTARPQPPTAAQIDAVQAQAQAMRQRLNTEPWETVAQSSGPTAANIPGGDLGCRPEEELPPTLVAGMKDVPVGTISAPIRWEMGWVIVRIDDRKVARTPPFEEVRDAATRATRQTFGSQFVTELLENVYGSFTVNVDPRFGRWDPARGQVLTPEGAAPAPTAPTTTTLPTLGGPAGGTGGAGPAAPPPTSAGTP